MSFEEQIMSKDKYPSVFSRQMKAIVYIFTVLRTERKMAHRFAEISEEEIEEALFYPSDLVNTKTTIPLRLGKERWIYTLTLRISVSYPPLFTSPSGDSCILLFYYFCAFSK